MGNYSDTKFASLGFGFLAGYLYPCYSRFCDPAEIGTHIIAVTADEHTLEEKRSRYPFPIYLNDNERALRELQPDVILFSPPPTVAPELARNVLKPYYDALRSAGSPLPDLYAFPPSPQADFYMDLIGQDLNVCNILPNMTREIAGQDLHGAEGNSYITMPSNANWPQDHIDRLEAVFKPLGGIVYVSPQHTRDMLATLCVAETLPLICFDISDGTDCAGHRVDSSKIAEVMRAQHQSAWGYHPEGSTPCMAENVSPELALALDAFCRAWTQGGIEYMQSVGMDIDTARKIMVSNVDLRLHIVQLEGRDEIERTLRAHATPGGVAERGRLCYELLVSEHIRSSFSKSRPGDESFFVFCREVAFEIAKIVAIHGRRMAGQSVPLRFTPEQHAVLYALFVQNARRMAGNSGAEAAHRGTLLYADQRGARMAKRALRDGETLTPLAYMEYGEWSPEPGTMRAEFVSYEPDTVQEAYVCPWHTAWRRFGLMEAGKEYCSCIDYHLVKGFSRNMELTVESNRPAGASCCRFVWKGFALDESKRKALAQKAAELGDSCRKDWVYHTRHIFSAMRDELSKLEDGEMIVNKTVEDFKVLYGADAAETVTAVDGMDFYEI